jgi:hypothetical protein
VLSQLNRAIKQPPNHQPMLQDLRETPRKAVNATRNHDFFSFSAGTAYTADYADSFCQSPRQLSLPWLWEGAFAPPGQ